MNETKCANCAFFDEYDECPDISETWKDDDTIGNCKRYPPTLMHENHRLANDFGCPAVRSSDWCGEFKAKTVSATPPAPSER